MRHALAALSLAVALPACVVADRLSGVSQAVDLQRTGLPAQATIVRIWDTGMTVNDDPVVGFLLDVRPASGAPWQAETKQLVSRLAVPAVQPGAVVAARYDPADHTRVSLALADRAPEPAGAHATPAGRGRRAGETTPPGHRRPGNGRVGDDQPAVVRREGRSGRDRQFPACQTG